MNHNHFAILVAALVIGVTMDMRGALRDVIKAFREKDLYEESTCVEEVGRRARLSWKDYYRGYVRVNVIYLSVPICIRCYRLMEETHVKVFWSCFRRVRDSKIHYAPSYARQFTKVFGRSSRS